MIRKRFNILLIFLSLGILSTIMIARDNNLKVITNRIYVQDPSFIFREIESGISSGNISMISKYLSAQTYLNLSNGISGYYSSNQAYYVLAEFFKLYRVADFSFDNIHTDENNPFATGTYNYLFRGKHETSEVYISLKHNGKRWKITQITIN
ncbi:MAG TPA: DUF4783 domain-containing protein [Ignavibacteriaceae bacterium]|nr:DUF4783 domain-containing protein [Ignavibacteriaceae bacterium]